GRDTHSMGFPLRMSEMLATLDGPAYVVRRAVDDPGDINRTKKAIRTAFQAQLNGLGFSLVEVLSACPVNWNLPARDAVCFIKDRLIPYYPLGDYKVSDSVKEL